MQYTFEMSPVAEIVLGVQYDGQAFTVDDQYKIYERFRDRYPSIREAPPLPSVIEDPDAPRIQSVPSEWPSRKHFVSSEGDRLVQVQQDRLLFNWRNETGGAEYPRFEKVFNEFENIVEIVSRTSDSQHAANQYEMTYIDHIPISDFGLEQYEIAKVLALGQQGVAYKHITIDYSVSYPSIGGTLNASVKSALRKDNRQKIIVLESTCRGFVEGMDLSKWFESAHKALLEHFHRLLTDRAKQLWGYREE